VSRGPWEGFSPLPSRVIGKSAVEPGNVVGHSPGVVSQMGERKRLIGLTGLFNGIETKKGEVLGSRYGWIMLEPGTEDGQGIAGTRKNDITGKGGALSCCLSRVT